MPRRETRESIERALAEQRRKTRMGGRDLEAEMLARMRQQIEQLRDSMDATQLARMEEWMRQAIRKLGLEIRKRRRPGDGSMPALAEPPRGPKPLTGGAAAPLEFD